MARIEMIDDFVAAGRDDFTQSLKTQESVIRCFEVIGKIIKRLSPDMLAAYPHIPWRRFAGFRDVLIHNYNNIDLDVVWDSIENDLPRLRQAVEAMIQSLDRPKDEGT